jgi:hypothetical protein
MATIYYKNDKTSDLLANLGLKLADLFYETKTRNDYYDSLSEALKGRQETIGKGTESIEKVQMNLPAGYDFSMEQTPEVQNGAVMNQFSQNRVPVMTPQESSPQMVNELSRYDLTEDELQNLDDKTRAQLELLGARVPKDYRVDPYTMVPDRAKRKNLEEELALRAQYRSPKYAIVDSRLYNMNDPEQADKADEKVQQGHAVNWIPQEQYSQFVRQFQNQQFLGSNEDLQNLLGTIKAKYTDPDTTREVLITDKSKAVAGLGNDSPEDRSLVKEMQDKIRKLSVKNWNNLTEKEKSNIEQIQSLYVEKMWKRRKQRIKKESNYKGIQY